MRKTEAEDSNGDTARETSRHSMPRPDRGEFKRDEELYDGFHTRSQATEEWSDDTRTFQRNGRS